MCEIIVCARDEQPTGNLAWDSKRPKQGDVIEAREDGFDWGDAVKGIVIPGNPNGNHPRWRWIKLPNVTVSQASTLLAPEVDVDPQRPSPYLQYRVFFLDKSKIPAGAFATYWTDDARTAPFITLPHTAAQLANIRTRRTPVDF